MGKRTESNEHAQVDIRKQNEVLNSIDGLEVFDDKYNPNGCSVVADSMFDMVLRSLTQIETLVKIGQTTEGSGSDLTNAYEILYVIEDLIKLAKFKIESMHWSIMKYFGDVEALIVNGDIKNWKVVGVRYSAPEKAD